MKLERLSCLVRGVGGLRDAQILFAEDDAGGHEGAFRRLSALNTEFMDYLTANTDVLHEPDCASLIGKSRDISAALLQYLAVLAYDYPLIAQELSERQDPVQAPSPPPAARTAFSKAVAAAKRGTVFSKSPPMPFKCSFPTQNDYPCQHSPDFFGGFGFCSLGFCLDHKAQCSDKACPLGKKYGHAAKRAPMFDREEEDRDAAAERAMADHRAEAEARAELEATAELEEEERLPLGMRAPAAAAAELAPAAAAPAAAPAAASAPPPGGATGLPLPPPLNAGRNAFAAAAPAAAAPTPAAPAAATPAVIAAPAAAPEPPAPPAPPARGPPAAIVGGASVAVQPPPASAAPAAATAAAPAPLARAPPAPAPPARAPHAPAPHALPARARPAVPAGGAAAAAWRPPAHAASTPAARPRASASPPAPAFAPAPAPQMLRAAAAAGGMLGSSWAPDLGFLHDLPRFPPAPRLPAPPASGPPAATQRKAFDVMRSKSAGGGTGDRRAPSASFSNAVVLGSVHARRPPAEGEPPAKRSAPRPSAGGPEEEEEAQEARAAPAWRRTF